MYNSDQTICAIATAPGNGAIALIRLSGPEALAIGDRIFVPAKKYTLLSNQAPNTIHFGTIKDHNETIDEVLVSLFKNPHSYTGEDTLEISCHGSVYIQQRIIELLLKSGASMARPGEFTQRAFLNGKMDLVQAEAVADVIASSSKAEHHLALNQLKGGVSAEMAKLRDELLQFVSLIELELDFSEEDVEFADRSQLTDLVNRISGLITSLLSTFKTGNAIKKGIPVAIVGKPNAGKSTLLNLLLKEDKAIVSEIAGTTRDVIEDLITIEGVNFRLIDTAGLRKTTDKIESLGIQKTLDNVRKAAIVILLCDAREDENALQEQIKALELSSQQQLLILRNKTDLLKNNTETVHNKPVVPYPCHYISAKSGQGIETINQNLYNLAQLDTLHSGDTILSNARHYEALSHSLTALQRVQDGIQNQLPTDLLAQDIREALHYLGEISGEITTDEILGNIFKNFCIGK